jgi:hypothetical protein
MEFSNGTFSQTELMCTVLVKVYRAAVLLQPGYLLTLTVSLNQNERHNKMIDVKLSLSKP